ncbi:excalibur calcium-binding domain-containing protein [Altererythrobacter sp. SALINAS58]|uniref:excalibur calcium-binding domain-containing protein n=1 Tax=Alteripontixanthobacter muriae TaxID=2705546 RepID=UPI0015754753|nr:excalibur calcium-binding domain-containing protein [Alteripontixanthobacter muriae]NTZ42158.1 excalibur calcium-binding domain-containing protein [Alteripontixanthobacter muriae]
MRQQGRNNVHSIKAARRAGWKKTKRQRSAKRLNIAKVRLGFLVLAFGGLGFFALKNDQVGFADYVYYPRCSFAHAKGVYSIRSGEPGYRSELDADADGLACEPYP